MTNQLGCVVHSLICYLRRHFLGWTIKYLFRIILKEVVFAPFLVSLLLVSLDEIHLMPLFVLVTIFVTGILYCIRILMPYIFSERWWQ